MSTSESGGGRRRGDLRERLVDAALGLLAEGGTEAISLRGVAQRAGVSAMAPYRHYPDKEALLAAVAARGFAGLDAAARAAGSGAVPGDAPAERAVAYVGFARANPALFRLMYGPHRLGHHPGLAEARAAVYATMTERMPASPTGLDPRVLGYWSVMHGLALLFLDGQLAGKDLGPDDELTRAVIRAMLPPDRGDAGG